MNLVENEVANLRAELSWSKNRIKELYDEVAKLDQRVAERDRLYDETLSRNIIIANEVIARSCRIEALESLVTDAFKIFDRYLNVPEAHELRERWAKLKAQ